MWSSCLGEVYFAAVWDGRVVHVIKMSMKTGACENGSHGPMVKDFTFVVRKMDVEAFVCESSNWEKISFEARYIQNISDSFYFSVGKFDNNISFPLKWWIWPPMVLTVSVVWSGMMLVNSVLLLVTCRVAPESRNHLSSASAMQTSAPRWCSMTSVIRASTV